MSAALSTVPVFRPFVRREFRESVPIDRLLVWTYRVQRADLVIEQGAGLERIEAGLDGVLRGATSTCGCAAVGRIAELGCQVDGGGGPAGHLHVDAERVHEAVMRLELPVALLVIRHARAGDAPDWVPELRLKSLRDHKGRPKMGYELADRPRNYGWCVVEPSASPVMVEARRLEYGLWHRALGALHLALRGRIMADHVALPPDAAAEPWLKKAA